MKAISSVIATILMLMIVIALAGSAYLFISGFFGKETAQTFSIVDSYQDTITIVNDGSGPIKTMTARIEGQDVPIAVVPSISGLVGYWSLNEGIGPTAYDSSGNNNCGFLGGNLVVNPGFEEGTSPWEFGGDKYLESGMLNCHSGDKCAKWIKSASNWIELGQKFTVTPNTQYNASGWFRTDGGGGRVGLWVRAAADCAGTGGWDNLYSTTTTNSYWTKIEYTVTTGATHNCVRIFGSTDAPAGSILWMDDVTFIRPSRMPSWVDGKFGKALNFVRSNSNWLEIDGDVGVNGEMTLAFWFNTPNKVPGQYIADNRDPGSWWFIKNYTSGACAAVDNNICFENRVMAQDSDWVVDKWTHLVITDDTTTAKMYIDGSLVDTGNGQVTTISTNLRFGTRYTESTYFDGMLDEISVFNRALSEPEVQQLYSGLVAPGQTGTVKILETLTKGTHSLRLCSPGMCVRGYVTII